MNKKTLCLFLMSCNLLKAEMVPSPSNPPTAATADLANALPQTPQTLLVSTTKIDNSPSPVMDTQVDHAPQIPNQPVTATMTTTSTPAAPLVASNQPTADELALFARANNPAIYYANFKSLRLNSTQLSSIIKVAKIQNDGGLLFGHGYNNMKAVHDLLSRIPNYDYSDLQTLVADQLVKNVNHGNGFGSLCSTEFFWALQNGKANYAIAMLNAAKTKGGDYTKNFLGGWLQTYDFDKANPFKTDNNPLFAGFNTPSINQLDNTAVAAIVDSLITTLQNPTFEFSPFTRTTPRTTLSDADDQEIWRLQDLLPEAERSNIATIEKINHLNGFGGRASDELAAALKNRNRGYAIAVLMMVDAKGTAYSSNFLDGWMPTKDFSRQDHPFKPGNSNNSHPLFQTLVTNKDIIGAVKALLIPDFNFGPFQAAP